MYLVGVLLTTTPLTKFSTTRIISSVKWFSHYRITVDASLDATDDQRRLHLTSPSQNLRPSIRRAWACSLLQSGQDVFTFKKLAVVPAGGQLRCHQRPCVPVPGRLTGLCQKCRRRQLRSYLSAPIHSKPFFRNFLGDSFNSEALGSTEEDRGAYLPQRASFEISACSKAVRRNDHIPPP